MLVACEEKHFVGSCLVFPGWVILLGCGDFGCYKGSFMHGWMRYLWVMVCTGILRFFYGSIYGVI